MFEDNMRTEAIPERVYTLCKIVEKKPLSSAELRERMEPEYLQNGSIYFPTYRSAAQELGLIAILDGMVTLCVEPKVVASLESMRRFINAHPERISGGEFYRVTQEYFRRGDKILTQEANVVNLAGSLSVSLGIRISGDEMRAWRFWATYLGFGFLQNMLLLPNAATFLRDAIVNSHLDRGMYSFGDFIAAIRPYCEIVFDEEISNHVLNYGVSNGLRTLHDMGIIRMEHILDQHDIWTLYPVSFHQIAGTVTNVTIL